MNTVYQSTFLSAGAAAAESLEDNFIIIFGEGAPDDIAEYCFLHRCESHADSGLTAGAVMAIGEQFWPVTAVGAVAQDNLRHLGHITIRFDGATEAEFPGTVHVSGPVPLAIAPGQTFRIVTE